MELFTVSKTKVDIVGNVDAIIVKEALQGLGYLLPQGDQAAPPEITIIIPEQQEQKNAEISFRVMGMTCASCVATVENQVRNRFDQLLLFDTLYSVKGVVDVSVSLLSEKATVSYDSRILSDTSLIQVTFGFHALNFLASD